MSEDAVDRIAAQWHRERPDLDTSPMELVGRISRAAALVQREIEAVFAEHGLTGADFDVLASLRRSGPPYRLTPGDLSRSTMVTTGGMTKRLDRLEARGLIRREPDPRDRRGRLVALTAEGTALVDRAVDAHYRNEARLLEGVPAARREQLVALLRELLLALEGPAEVSGPTGGSRRTP